MLFKRNAEHVTLIKRSTKRTLSPLYTATPAFNLRQTAEGELLLRIIFLLLVMYVPPTDVLRKTTVPTIQHGRRNLLTENFL